jgi:hypothetical protein
MGRKKTDARPFWTIDAETDPFLKGRMPKPFIWGLYNGNSFWTFETTEKLIEEIKDQEVIVYAHNGGRFDFHFLLPYINLREDIKIINGRLVSAKIGACEIRDSYALLPEPLRSFGGKLDIDMAKLEPEVRTQHMAEIIEYLKGDCVSLWDTIFKFEQKYGRHLTQAGAAMAFWERIHGKPAPKTDQRYFTKFKEYYYGGRVQCFQKGHIKGPIQVRDIRSAYARAMLEAHPYEPIYTELAYPREIKATDMVTLDCVSLGALPFRGDKGGMSFPDDNLRRRYYVPGHEVIAAKETGSLREVEIINAVRFHHCIDFEPYITHFWEGRKKDIENGDEVNSLFKKRLMNSLYGKWAANPDNYGNFMAVPWSEKFDYAEEGYEFNGTFGPHTIVRKDLEDWQKRFYNVATAASITSYVRAMLWRGIHKSNGVVYCDTDCIMAEVANVDEGDNLGQWTDEGTAKDAWIAGKKMYYLVGDFAKGKKTKQASKGVKLTGPQIKEVALGATVKWENDAPTFTLSGKRDAYFQVRNVKMTA